MHAAARHDDRRQWGQRHLQRHRPASCADRLRTDPVKGWVGTLVDEHSTNRYHAIWNLIPYNSKWAYTVTAEWHMLTTA